MFERMLARTAGTKLKFAVFVLLLGHACSIFWAAISLRPMFADGAVWFFRILDTTDTFLNDQYLRLFTAVFQWPTVAYLRLFPYPNSSQIAIVILSFSYSFYPLVSLIGTYFLLKRFCQTEFIIFPIFSFALFTQALMIYPSVIVPEALALFWPLFFLLLFRRKEKPFEFLLAVALIAGLAYSYEQSAILTIFCASILLLKVLRKTSVRGDLLLVLMNFTVTLFFLWRISIPIRTGAKDHVVETWDLMVHPKLDAFGVFGANVLLALAIAVLLFYFRKTPKVLFWAAFIAIAVTTFFYIRFMIREDSWHAVFGNVWGIRVYMIPMTTILAALVIPLVFFAPKVLWYKCEQKVKMIYFLLVAVLAISLVRDLVLTIHWRREFENIRVLQGKYPGCNVLSPKAFERLFRKESLIDAWNLPFFTLIPRHENIVDSAFFIEEVLTGKVCMVKDKEPIYFGMNPTFQVFQGVQNLDHSGIQRGPIRLFSVDEKNKLQIREMDRL